MSFGFCSCFSYSIKEQQCGSLGLSAIWPQLLTLVLVGLHLATIITATGAVCRIGAGVLSDVLHRSISRIVFLLALSLLLPVGFIILAIGADVALTIGSVFIGAGFGSAWCLVPLVVYDSFGQQYFSTIWGIVIMGSAIGPFILQPIDSAVQAAHSTAKHCLGVQCYEITYIVCFVINVIATLLLWLQRLGTTRKRHIPTRDVVARAHDVTPF